MRSTMGGSVYRNVLESNIGKNGIGPVMRLKFLALPLTDPEASPCIVIENYRFIRFDFQFSIFWIIIISFRIFHFSFFLFFFFPNFRFFQFSFFPFHPLVTSPPLFSTPTPLPPPSFLLSFRPLLLFPFSLLVFLPLLLLPTYLQLSSPSHRCSKRANPSFERVHRAISDFLPTGFVYLRPRWRLDSATKSNFHASNSPELSITLFV